MKRFALYIALLLVAVGCNSHLTGTLSLDGDCLIDSLVLDGCYAGVIDRSARSVVVTVPEDYNTRAMCITYLSVSEGATASVSVGDTLCLHESRVLRLTNGDTYLDWTLTAAYPVVEITQPKVLFLGQSAAKSSLSQEERTACDWLLRTVPSSAYASITDFRSGKIDLSECQVIWWHFHKDGGVDGKTAFESAANDAVLAVEAFQSYLDKGGSLLLTRYATYLPGYLSFPNHSRTNAFPNNCWGQNETEAETTTSPWYFLTDTLRHPIYANLRMGDEPKGIYLCDAGYHITNSTAQWHIGSDWGGYPTLADFVERTGATPLGQGSDGAVVVWEFPRTASQGGVLCIGSGCYDWYSVDGVYGDFHANMDTLTLNAINYLCK